MVFPYFQWNKLSALHIYREFNAFFQLVERQSGGVYSLQLFAVLRAIMWFHKLKHEHIIIFYWRICLNFNIFQLNDSRTSPMNLKLMRLRKGLILNAHCIGFGRVSKFCFQIKSLLRPATFLKLFPLITYFLVQRLTCLTICTTKKRRFNSS